MIDQSRAVERDEHETFHPTSPATSSSRAVTRTLAASRSSCCQRMRFAARRSLRQQVLVCIPAGREQELGQVIRQHAVVLLRHRAVPAPEASFEVRHRDADLPRSALPPVSSSRRPVRRQGRGAPRSTGSRFSITRGRLLRMRTGPHPQEVIGCRQVEILEERVGHRGRSAVRCGPAPARSATSSSARITGATFMKFGRVPTTWRTFKAAR